MGRFSTTLAVKSADLANEFTKLMKKRCFELCEEDVASLVYLVAQGDTWATLVEESYFENPQQAKEDAAFLAKELKTAAFTVEVVDSDFAILTLAGKEQVIVGDGSGYGMEAARADKSLWEPLLSHGTFEELSEIWENDEVFVEEALCKSAPLFGIETQFIVADFCDLSEISDNQNITAFYFKKPEEA